MPESVTLPQLFERAGDLHGEDLATALPCRVVRYDGAKQTVDVKPCVRRPLVDEEGAVTFEDIGDILNVPVLFPSGGGFACVFPLAQGDFVFVVFSQLDPGQWRLRGETPSNPGQTRAHGLGGGFALPCIRPTSGALASHPSGKASIGKDGSENRIEFDSSKILLGANASDFVALASKVDQCMTLIAAHVHPYTGAVGPTSPSTTLTTLPPVGSTLVGAK